MIPDVQKRPYKRWGFRDMKAGDDFEVGLVDAERVRSAVAYHQKRFGGKFTTRRTKGGLKVYCLEPTPEKEKNDGTSDD